VADVASLGPRSVSFPTTTQPSTAISELCILSCFSSRSRQSRDLLAVPAGGCSAATVSTARLRRFRVDAGHLQVSRKRREGADHSGKGRQGCKDGERFVMKDNHTPRRERILDDRTDSRSDRGIEAAGVDPSLSSSPRTPPPRRPSGICNSNIDSLIKRVRGNARCKPDGHPRELSRDILWSSRFR